MSCPECEDTFGKLREFVNTIRDGELLRRKLDELADLRAYKERTEAGLGAKPRGWAQLRDALERREKAAKSEDNRACWWWALKEMDAIEAMFSKANPPQAEVQP